MIKYYTYYSCGGYKDIYIGSDQDSSDASYFIPLLNVWKKNNRPENADKISRAENVQHVELISKSNSAGFPSECNLMFSHGGYKAIFRTLNDGRLCLSIRDIPNGAKDEEGRDTPFNFLFLADGQESIEQLDALALEYLTNSNKINELIANAISYDPVVNGVRFDLRKFNQLLTDRKDTPKKLSHTAGNIDYLKIFSRNQYKLSLSEQALDANNVNSFWDDNGLFYGNLAYKGEAFEPTYVAETIDSANVLDVEEPSVTQSLTDNISHNHTKTEHKSKVNKVDTTEIVENIPASSQKDEIASESNIETHLQQIDQKISSLATAEALDNLQFVLKKLSNESNSILNSIQEKLNDQTETATTSQFTLVERSNELNLLSNPIIIAIGCLIVGFVLGAVVF